MVEMRLANFSSKPVMRILTFFSWSAHLASSFIVYGVAKVTYRLIDEIDAVNHSSVILVKQIQLWNINSDIRPYARVPGFTMGDEALPTFLYSLMMPSDNREILR